MKSEKAIGVACILNLLFALVEAFGGMLTGSVAILSDALHDLGDAVSVGIAFFLERLSRRKPDQRYTYGYVRYRVLGGLCTVGILLAGSVAVIGNAVVRLFRPVTIHSQGMVALAVLGTILNLVAALLTRKGDSINQRAVSLHMLEDVLGWLVVLVGSVVMQATELWILDPLMSIAVAVFIFFHGVGHLREILIPLTEQAPAHVTLEQVRQAVTGVSQVEEVHHIHLWCLEPHCACATMHLVTQGDPQKVRSQTREALKALGIAHVTLELEQPGEPCGAVACPLPPAPSRGHCHSHLGAAPCKRK